MRDCLVCDISGSLSILDKDFVVVAIVHLFKITSKELETDFINSCSSFSMVHQ